MIEQIEKRLTELRDEYERWKIGAARQDAAYCGAIGELERLAQMLRNEQALSK